MCSACLVYCVSCAVPAWSGVCHVQWLLGSGCLVWCVSCASVSCASVMCCSNLQSFADLTEPMITLNLPPGKDPLHSMLSMLELPTIAPARPSPSPPLPSPPLSPSFPHLSLPLPPPSPPHPSHFSPLPSLLQGLFPKFVISCLCYSLFFTYPGETCMCCHGYIVSDNARICDVRM